MRRSLCCLFLLFTACSRPVDDDAFLAHTQSMNVVVVVIDAAAADHFSWLGYDRETTPHLSAVASEAVIFETAYAQASATPLSVYSYLTSRYPLVNRTVPQPGEVAPMFPAGLPTLASSLHEAFPRRGGFSANQWVCDRLDYDNGFTDFYELWDENAETPEESVRQTAPRVSDRAIEWLASPEKFFAYLHYLEPHTPYTPPEPYLSQFDPQMRGHVDGTPASLAPYREVRPPDPILRNTMALYDGNLAFVDAQIGRVIDELKASGRWEQTIFVLLSDHGEAFWQHGIRGHGKHVYEEFVRVPFLIRVPGSPQMAGRRISDPVQLVDLMPTLLHLAGASPPEGMVGRSLVPQMLGEPGPQPPTAFFRNHEGGKWIYAIRRGQFKYVAYFGRQEDQLFDLAADPRERRSVLQVAPGELDYSAAEVAQSLAQALDNWIQTGMALDAASVSSVDSLDARSQERLKAMGYLN